MIVTKIVKTNKKVPSLLAGYPQPHAYNQRVRRRGRRNNAVIVAINKDCYDCYKDCKNK
jgi:hypothetical protein